MCVQISLLTEGHDRIINATNCKQPQSHMFSWQRVMLNAHHVIFQFRMAHLTLLELTREQREQRVHAVVIKSIDYRRFGRVNFTKSFAHTVRRRLGWCWHDRSAE